MTVTPQFIAELRSLIMARATVLGRAAEADRRLTWTDQGWMIGDLPANQWINQIAVIAEFSTRTQ